MRKSRALGRWTGWALVTVATKSHLGRARVCCQSFLRHHPGADAYVLLVDRVDDYFDPKREVFKTVPMEHVRQDGLTELAFKYTPVELSMAMKPAAIRHVFQERGVERVIYLDSDMYVLDCFEEARRSLELNDILLTPHILSPMVHDGRMPSEMDFLRTGMFNAGFLGFRSCDNVFGFLEWWRLRLVHTSVDDASRGLYFDQKWLDLLPIIFRGVGIIRHMGYNVGYWNIHERRNLESVGGRLGWKDLPLVCFHFSGVVPERIEMISRYQNRLALQDVGEGYRELFSAYVGELKACLDGACREWPYAFGVFSNGVRIPGIVRRSVGRAEQARVRIANPFEVEGRDSLFSWLTGESREGSALPGLLSLIWESRIDLQAAFPDREGADALALRKWAVDHGSREYDLDPRLVEYLRT